VYNNAQAGVNAHKATLASAKAALDAELSPIRKRLQSDIDDIMRKVDLRENEQSGEILEHMRNLLAERIWSNQTKYDALVESLTKQRETLASLVNKANEKRAAYLTWDNDADVDECRVDPFGGVPKMIPVDVETTLCTLMYVLAAPTTKVPVTKVLTTKVPVTKVSTKVSTAKVPAAKVPVTKVPAAKVPAAKVPAAKVPTAKVPAAKVPTANAPAAKAPTADAADTTNTAIAAAAAAAKAAAKTTTNSNNKKRSGGRSTRPRKVVKRVRCGPEP